MRVGARERGCTWAWSGCTKPRAVLWTWSHSWLWGTYIGTKNHSWVLGDPISTAYRNLLKRPQHNIFLFMLIQSPMPFHRFSFANSYRYFHHNSTIYYLYYTTLLIVYIFPMIPLIILEVILWQKFWSWIWAVKTLPWWILVTSIVWDIGIFPIKLFPIRMSSLHDSTQWQK